MKVLMINEPDLLQEDLKEFAEVSNSDLFFANSLDEIFKILNSFKIDIVVIYYRTFSDLTTLNIITQNYSSKIYLKINKEVQPIFQTLSSSKFELIENTSTLFDFGKVVSRSETIF